MEKIEGVDLDDYLYRKNYQPIDQNLAIEWLEQLAKILAKVHHHNFFHRDIKPSNIILKPNGQLVLIDFGAVRQVTQTILAGGQNTRLFTSGYAPPEQERGYAVQQSDFFALGRTFVFLLTGKDPNSSEIYDYQHNELNWRKLAPQIDPKLADFIDLLMADKVNQRPENIDVILKGLKQLKKQLNISAKAQSLPLQTPSPTQAITLYNYAGFWIRTKAAIVDSLIVLILAAIAGYGIGEQLIASKILIHWSINLGLIPAQDFLFAMSLLSGIGATPLGYLVPFIFLILWFVNPSYFVAHYTLPLAALILGVVVKWSYFIFLESSPLKATLGKLLFGLIVVDNNGDKISLKQANKRYWAKVISLLTVYIGYFLAGWTKKKRALHDMIAGTLIIKKI